MKRGEGMTLRQAALAAGFGMLVMSAAAPWTQFYVFPRLIVDGDIESTATHIITHQGLYLAGILGYLINFLCDLVVAWALFILLAPVNRALSLLTAWFRLVYTGISLFSLFKLVSVFQLLTTPYDLTVFGAGPLHAQVKFLLDSFRTDWSTALILFGIHLGLLGVLVFQSGHIPKLLGVLLTLDGAAWVVNSTGPYLFPGVRLGFLFYIFFAELLFMLWLLIMGWKIPEPNELEGARA